MHVVSLLLMVALMGVLLIITPLIMPKNECFAVTVPVGARNQEPLKGYLRGYMRWMSLVVVLSLLAWVAALLGGLFEEGVKQDSITVAVFVTATLLVPALFSFALMLFYRSRVQAIKAERGWTADQARAAAYVGPDQFPRPISVAWNLLYIPLIVIFSVAALAFYDQFPDTIPMHADFNGVVNEYAPKSYGVVLFPVYVIAFIGLVMTACHIGMVYSKKPTDPDAPASSALAYGRFARLQSIALVAGGIGLSAVLGTTILLSSLGVISLGHAGVVIEIAAIVFAVAIVVVSVRTGQSGARIAAQPSVASQSDAASSGGAGQDGLGMARDDDAHWPLGVFYFNAEEPSIFVPKRFGFGWTINLGRPLSWVVLVAFVLVVVGFVIGVSALVS